jgi:signal peptidase I
MRDAKKYLDKKILFPLFAGFLAFILVKTFCIDFVIVRSPAMQPSLRQGEYLFITRIFTPHRGDVVEVSLPLLEKDTAQEKIRLFKRIAAMPGDTLEIRSSQLYVNGSPDQHNERDLHNYIAKIPRQADSVVFDKTGITERFLVDDSCVYLVVLNDQQYRDLQAQEEIRSLQSNREDSAVYDESVFPFDPNIKWNKDYFGPLYIPKKGDELKLTPENVKYYARIIHDLEGNALEVEKGKIYLNENEVNTYKVKDDYYFLIGDNFDNSVDSRQWGFIPRERITARTLRKK